MGGKKSKPTIAELGKATQFKAGTKRVKEMATLGGLANKDNPNSKVGQYMRHLKKKGMTDETAAMIHDMMTDPDFSAIHIIRLLTIAMDSIKNDSEKKPAELNAIIRTVVDVHKINHGTKEHNKKVDISHTILTKEERQSEILRIIKLE